MGNNKVKSNEKILAYRFWPGFQLFLCKGHLMIPKAKNRPLSLFAVFLLCEALFLATLISKYSSNALGITLNILLFIFTTLSYLKLFTSDPGFIPRQSPPYAKGPLRAEPYSIVVLRDPCKEIALTQPFIQYPINGTIYKFKYCKSCLILRPPRTSHCNDCNSCIEKYDHHCPWLGICIGKKNYAKFYQFIGLNTAYFNFNWTYGLYLSIFHSKGLENFVQSNWGFLIFFILSFLICAFFSMLLGFHSYLIITQQTTREYMKKAWKNEEMVPFAVRYWWLRLFSWCDRRVSFKHFNNLAEVSMNFEHLNINPSVLALKHKLSEDTKEYDKSFIEKSNGSINLTTFNN